MNHPDFFKPWLTQKKWIIYVFLSLLLLCALISFGLFALNQQYVISYFGAQPEDISLANLLTYAGIIAVLTIQFRFLQYFERRAYLLTVILAGIGLSIANLYVKDLYVFMALRVLTGFQAVSMAGCILTLLFAAIPPPKTMIVASTVFYGAVLGNTVFIGILFAWVTEKMDWQFIYMYLALFQVTTLIIALFLLNRNAGMKRYPLYQLDGASFIFCLIALISLAYAVIYGPRYYWFSDGRVRIAAILSIVAFIILFYRQTIKKRPYWHPAVFKVRNFFIGAGLLLIYYTVKDSINLIYGYCIGIVRWDSFAVMLLGSCNLSGVILFMIIGAKLMVARKISFRTLFLTGFGSLLIYHWWMIRIFTPDLSFADLAFPVFLQGAASGFLFVPIVLFMVSSLPAVTGFTGLALAALTRFMATLIGIAGFYLLQLYFNQLNRESLLAHLTSLDPAVSQRMDLYTGLFRSGGFTSDQASALATGNLSRILVIQGQLLTDMQVFKTMAVIITGLMLLIVIAPALGKFFHRLYYRYETNK